MSEEFVIADAAYLMRDEASKVVLCVGSIAYDADEKVPTALRARQKLPSGASAGYFVEVTMRQRFGDDKSQWPALAAGFVSGH